MTFTPKRAGLRIDAQLTGRMIFPNGEEQTVVTKNINAYGAYLMAEKCPAIGDRVTLRLQWPFPLEDREPAFEVCGTVLRVEPLSEEGCCFAVKFEEPAGL
ncbi:MAG TPA: PilZ domain-containing protein [Acidobacteriota bacterium]|jgi:hypothetical protein|nr:PilZ domain-containing protein [Acidobacteriota bacterium]